MKMQMIPLPIKGFHYDRESHTLTAEASDFGRGFHIARVYDDAMDLGISIQGRTVQTFILAEEVRDTSGDIVLWNFVAENSSKVNVKAVVFND